VNVDLPLAIGIPVDYIADQTMRLKLYRRLADMQNENEVQTMEDEFVDRFGPLPEPAVNLFYQMRVKLRAEAAGLASISMEGEQIVLRYPPLPEGASRPMPYPGVGVRTGRHAFWMPVASQNGSQDWRAHLLEVLANIVGEREPS